MKSIIPKLYTPSLNKTILPCINSPLSNITQVPARQIFGSTFVSNRLTNGILEQDNYLRQGMPESKFKLSDTPSSSTLQEIFDRNKHSDPFDLVSKDLRSISESIREVIGSDHPVLERIARYFFDVKGKRVRPTIVLLISRAIAGEKMNFPSKTLRISSSDDILSSQKRLSEITEMIHTASLLHDDVIDEADTRRGVNSINAVFGNKLAILGGDFLLARASVALARLRNCDVVELLSVVIEHLVKGEVMQIKPTDSQANFKHIDYYMTKTFYKTASLIANSCKASAVLADHSPRVQEIAFEYGKHLGLTFQIVDDLLDFVGNDAEMGKPTHNDLQQGIATLPVLYAADQFPQLHDMIARKFKYSGDVEEALRCVERSNALERAKTLALSCAESAIAAAEQLPSSDARSALINLVNIVLTRKN